MQGRGGPDKSDVMKEDQGEQNEQFYEQDRRKYVPSNYDCRIDF